MAKRASGRRTKKGAAAKANGNDETDTSNSEQAAGYDPEKVKSYVERIENLHGDVESIMASARRKCRPVHDDIKEVYTEAKDVSGIPKRVLAKVIRARAHEHKAELARQELEAEDQDSFDNIRLALGDLADTPLGAAALNKAEDNADVRPRHLQEP